MNASLKYLSNCDVSKYFLLYSNQKTINKFNENSSKGRISNTYQTHIVNLWKRDSGIFSSADFKQKIESDINLVL